MRNMDRGTGWFPYTFQNFVCRGYNKFILNKIWWTTWDKNKPWVRPPKYIQYTVLLIIKNINRKYPMIISLYTIVTL